LVSIEAQTSSLCTDTGKVMKVVFASEGTSGIFPVIAEEITVSMKEVPS